jgi:hypothetical protein
MMGRRDIMTDLTLHEYGDLSEEELKGMLKREVRQMYGPDTFVKNLEGKTNTLSSIAAASASKTSQILFRLKTQLKIRSLFWQIL